MIFFTSDWHLSHMNIIKYCNRPFSSVEEMNETILEKFRDRVSKGDMVYFLGDFSFKNYDGKLINDFFESITNQRIQFHFIKGSHDKYLPKFVKNHCSSISDLKNVIVNKQNITLCHYPMISFHCSHYGTWQLYGHHHRDLSEIATGKKMNVCIDLHNFYPVSFEEVKEYMKKREDNWDIIKKSRNIV